MEARLVRIREAAAYCNMSPSAFKAWITRIGLKSRVKGSNRYDIRALDIALDRLSGIQPELVVMDDNRLFQRELKKANKNAILFTKHQQDNQAQR